MVYVYSTIKTMHGPINLRFQRKLLLSCKSLSTLITEEMGDFETSGTQSIKLATNRRGNSKLLPAAQLIHADCSELVQVNASDRLQQTRFNQTPQDDYNNRKSVDKKNQLDVTFCILYFSSNSCSTCFGQPCAHHQELTTA